MDNFRGGFEPRPSDIFIAVMGVTGAGKSTFISTCTDVDVPIGHNLQACTQNVAVYRYEYSPSVNIYLVDTPGFDDTSRSDTEVLREIAAWLTESYSHKVRLRGVLYLHRITDPRMQGSAKKNLFMFKKLCGPDALKNVILVTTMWEKVDHEDGERREAELISTPEFWGFMMNQGSQVYRHQNNEASAKRALEMFLDENIEESAITLDIQDEMVNNHKSLDETEAGRELDGALQQERQRSQKAIAELRQMMEEALELRDKESAEQLRIQKEEMAMNLDKIRREREELKVSIEELHRNRFDQLEKQLSEEREARAALQKMQLDHMSSMQRLMEKAKTPEPPELPQAQSLVIPRHLVPNDTMLRTAKPSRDHSVTFLALQGEYYYLKGPKKSAIRNCLKTPDKKTLVKFVVFGMNGSFLKLAFAEACGWNSDFYLARSDNFRAEYPKLNKHISSPNLYGNCPVSITLGPNGTFWYRGKGSQGHNLPSTFPKEQVPNVKYMWLGYGGAWVMTSHTDEVKMDLQGYYEGLDEAIMASSSGISGLEMDLTNPQISIVVFEDGSSWYSRRSEDDSPGLTVEQFDRYIKEEPRAPRQTLS